MCFVIKFYGTGQCCKGKKAITTIRTTTIIITTENIYCYNNYRYKKQAVIFICSIVIGFDILVILTNNIIIVVTIVL